MALDNICALILFKISALYKLFIYLLTYTYKKFHEVWKCGFQDT